MTDDPQFLVFLRRQGIEKPRLLGGNGAQLMAEWSLGNWYTILRAKIAQLDILGYQFKFVLDQSALNGIFFLRQRG